MAAPLRSYLDAIEPEPEVEVIECAHCFTEYEASALYDLNGDRVCLKCRRKAQAAAKASERIGSDLAAAIAIVNAL